MSKSDTKFYAKSWLEGEGGVVLRVIGHRGQGAAAGLVPMATTGSLERDVAEAIRLIETGRATGEGRLDESAGANVARSLRAVLAADLVGEPVSTKTEPDVAARSLALRAAERKIAAVEREIADLAAKKAALAALRDEGPGCHAIFVDETAFDLRLVAIVLRKLARGQAKGVLHVRRSAPLEPGLLWTRKGIALVMPFRYTRPAPPWAGGA